MVGIPAIFSGFSNGIPIIRRNSAGISYLDLSAGFKFKLPGGIPPDSRRNSGGNLGKKSPEFRRSLRLEDCLIKENLFFWFIPSNKRSKKFF
jgi:hypothetical protein